MDKSVNYEQYAKLLTFDGFTGESSIVASSDDKVKEDDIIDSSDDGYQYFQEASREECDEVGQIPLLPRKTPVNVCFLRLLW